MLRRQLRIGHGFRNRALIITLMTLSLVAPHPVSAGFFDFLFGGSPASTSAAPDSSAPADSAGTNPSEPGSAMSAGRYAAYCVRMCDGKYFPLTGRGDSTPAQTCQSFCPASATKVFSGGAIETAVGPSGERYVDSPNAFAYRKALKTDCTCNGRDPGGLAPVDVSLDTTLRPGDIVATSSGLLAYSSSPSAGTSTGEFTPVASYPGLTGDVRSRLGGMKVAPVKAEISEDTYTMSVSDEPVRTVAQPVLDAPVIAPPKTRRAAAR